MGCNDEYKSWGLCGNSVYDSTEKNNEVEEENENDNPDYNA